MILDCHIHMMSGKGNRDAFLHRLQEAGVDGGILCSLPPASFPHLGQSSTPEERLASVMYWTEPSEYLFPFYWIDPLEDSAVEQVEKAVEEGVSGFKVICNHFYPGNERALEVFKVIAEAGKPILFHSGILWDGTNSSQYNRPVGFEALLEVNGLRFALAHISWPWCDELIAVYGKYQSTRSRRKGFSTELFVDVTPGTPPIYREEALRKLLTVGYDVKDNVLFGTDCRAEDYNALQTQQRVTRDTEIFEVLGLSLEAIEKIYSKNLLRFVGVE
ncbi:MAG: amidohydrolase family protein [Firmicutes bacterium]|nr:amidohydrolase family protein [Bacillota bacterium]